MKERVEQTFFQLDKLIQTATPQVDGLLGGTLGLCLYYHSLFRAFHKNEYAEKAISLIEQVYANLEQNQPRLSGNSFSSGGAGLGYVANLFFRDGFIELDPDADLQALDEFLYQQSLEQILNQDKVDFLHGALGTIHYFTQRLPEKKIQQQLTNLVTAFCNKAVREEKGIWFRNWFVDKSQLSEINFSLSHGLTGWLLVLVNAYRAGLQLPCIMETVEKGIEFLLSHRCDVEIGKNQWSFFPSTIKVDDRSDKLTSNRLAWCYGDLGVVLLLYRTAQILDKPEWIAKANLMGTFTLMRKEVISTAATEAMFCHGTAGLAQFYKTLYDISGIERYLEGQMYWVEQTLKLLPFEMEKGTYHRRECEMLEGLVGINLSLLSYISEEQFAWTKTLLL